MKLHPFTAVRDALTYGSQAGSFGLFLVLVAGGTGALPVGPVVGLAALGVVAGLVYGVARYAAFEYELRETTLAITSGVVRRQAREIPLGRVQNVDVQQSFLGRALGLAVVRFETAGGGETEGELRLVGIEEAERLQTELRRRKRAVRAAEGTAAEVDGASGEPEPTLLFELSPAELVVLAAVSFRWGVVPLLAFGYPLFEDPFFDFVERLVLPSIRAGEFVLGDPRLLLVALLGAAGYLLLTWVVSAAITVVRYYGFRLERIDDELVYERGLLQRYSGTVPLDKVQALSVEENLPMRRLGYAALSVETAGYAPGGGTTGRSPSAIPLAERGTVLSLVESIGGVADVGVERPPRRARRRYAGRYALVVLGVAAAFAAVHLLVVPLGVLWALPAAAAVAALPAAHLKWVHLGHRADEHGFLAREGFWRRSTRVVPYYRLQTVLTVRTVFQRRWGLASVVGDTASSSSLLSREATAHDVDDATARDLHETLRERLQADLRRRRTDRGRRAAPSGDAGEGEEDAADERGTDAPAEHGEDHDRRNDRAGEREEDAPSGDPVDERETSAPEGGAAGERGKPDPPGERAGTDDDGDP